jgi:hypothetical protein
MTLKREVNMRWTGFLIALGAAAALAAAPATKPAGRHTAYIVDVSGSMLDQYDAVRLKVSKDVDAAAADDRLSVILLVNGEARKVGELGSKASPATRRRIVDALHMTTPLGSGEAAVLPEAVKTLSDAKPDRVVLLSDHKWGGDQSQLIKRVKDANKAGVRLDTLIDFTEAGDRRNAWLMANENGGACYNLNGEEVGEDGKPLPR